MFGGSRDDILLVDKVCTVFFGGGGGGGGMRNSLVHVSLVDLLCNLTQVEYIHYNVNYGREICKVSAPLKFVKMVGFWK